MLDFINENYVWLIVIGVLIIMAIIGYFADKTDFGKKEFEKKVKVKKEKPIKEKPIKERNRKEVKVEEPDMIIEEAIIDEKPVEMIDEKIIEEENFSDIIEEPNFESEEVGSYDTQEELVANLEDLATNQEETISEDLYAPLDLKMDDYVSAAEINNEVVEEPFKEIDTTEAVFQEESDIELPKIEDLKTDVVEDEEDVWKF